MRPSIGTYRRVNQEEELRELIEHKADETIWLRMRRLCPHTAMYLSHYNY